MLHRPYVTPFCSSSKGNSAYINGAGVLIDAGCSFKQFCSYISAHGIGISEIRGILITHEHIDHVKGLKVLTKQTGIPVYATESVAGKLIRGDMVSPNSELRIITALSGYEIDGLSLEYSIRAFRTSHDSAESVGFIFEKKGLKIGYCTDTGTITPDMKYSLAGSDILFIEANYDREMLRQNPNYPYYLKKRIASEEGHLSNDASAEFIRVLAVNGTSEIILGHLSQENNTPAVASGTVKRALTEAGLKEGVDYTLDVAPVSSLEPLQAV